VDEANSFEVPLSWGLVSFAALCTLIVAPPVFFIYVGAVPAKVMLAGAGLWAVSVAFKHLLGGVLRRSLRSATGVGLASALHGFLSAVTELGAAGIYLFTWENAPLLHIVAFGAGAGCAEVLYVLIWGSFTRADEGKQAAWARSAASSLCVRYTVPLERVFALVGHTGSRGLVWVALHDSGFAQISLLTIAIVLFTAVDAVAAYGLHRQWNWDDPQLCRRTHLFFGGISVLELATFILVFPDS
jgi:hypothetical protein